MSLFVRPEERLVIIRQSGAGKTTILRLLFGILTPTRGSTFFRQRDIAHLSANEMREIRAHIGMVYEDAALRSSRNVRENLALPLEELTRKTRGEIAIKSFSSRRKLP